MRVHLYCWRQLGILCLFGFFWVSPAQAQCNSDHWTGTDPLASYLDGCTRQAQVNEQTMFTWGHRDKLQNLRTLSWANYSAFNTAFQDTYSSIKALQDHELSPIAGHQNLSNFVQYLNSSYGLADIQELHQFTNDPIVLLALQNIWQKLVDPDLPRVIAPMPSVPTKPKDLDIKAVQTVTPHAVAGLKAMAYEQLHPGFLRYLQAQDIAILRAELAALKAELVDNRNNTDPPSIEEHRVDGKILGFDLGLQAGGASSNTSYGPAVYLSNSPAAFLSHFEGVEFIGFACRLTQQNQITDIFSIVIDEQNQHNPEIFLRERNVYLSNQTQGRLNYPTRRNKLADPQRFRLAIQNRLTKNTPLVYTDTGSLDYSDCTPIEPQHFSSCNDVKTLANNLISGGQSNAVYSYLTNNENKDRVISLADTILECAQPINNDNSNLATSTCGELRKPNFKELDIYKNADARGIYRAALKACEPSAWKRCLTC